MSPCPFPTTITITPRADYILYVNVVVFLCYTTDSLLVIFKSVRVHLFAHINGFMYTYIILIILFYINHLFTLIVVVSSIAHTNSFICTQLNSFKNRYYIYSYIILIIQFYINHLFALIVVVSSIAHTNSFICTQLNSFKNRYSTLIILSNPILSFANS